uniref:Uncharacterized protein n=1 Tax=Anguilla anguilla TaxID=7936 RepID=A0A0E9T6G2_ANGAN
MHSMSVSFNIFWYQSLMGLSVILTDLEPSPCLVPATHSTYFLFYHDSGISVYTYRLICVMSYVLMGVLILKNRLL